MQTTIYLVRHALPQSHALNGGLTEEGVAQAKKTAAYLRKEISGKHIHGHSSRKPLLVVSPTNRTRETADHIAKALHIQPLTHSAFSENYLVDTRLSFLSPSFLAHHVASSRIFRAFWGIVNKNPGKTVIVVTHGNVIRVLCGKLLSKTFEEMSQTPVTCSSVTTIAVKGPVASILKYK